MATVLAIVIGSNDVTVATHTSGQAPDVRKIDVSVVGAPVRIGDDARLAQPGLRVGDPVPIFLPDGTSSTGATLVARTIAELMSRRSHDMTVVIRPATWSRYATAALQEELGRCGVSPTLLDRATVADHWLRITGVIGVGNRAVVVDAGDDDSVVSCSRYEAGRTGVVTEPGSDPFGTVFLDRMLLAHIVEQIQIADPSFDPSDPRHWNELHDLALRASAARRRLASSPAVEVDTRVDGVRRPIRVVRSEFDELIAADVERMASRVAGTLAQFDEPVEAVVLHGSAATVPSVVETLSRRTRRPVVVAHSPDSVVVKGAVLWAVENVDGAAPTTRITQVPETVAPVATGSSLWSRSRVWLAGTAAAVVLVGGGFAAAGAMATPDAATTIAPPTAHSAVFEPGGR